MKSFNYNRIVKLLGVVSLGTPNLIIMELMARSGLTKH